MGGTGQVSANGCLDDAVKCADGTCVNDLEDCVFTSGCPYRCPNGLCVGSELWCPQLLVQSPGNCDDNNMTNATYPCADGTCATSAAECSNIPYCGLTTDKLNKRRAYRCGDGSCRLKAEYCPGGSTCPTSRPIRCPLGECVAEVTQCIAAVPTCPDSNPQRCPGGQCISATADPSDPANCGGVGFSRGPNPTMYP